MPAGEARRDALALEEGAFVGALKVRSGRNDATYVVPRVMVTRSERELLEGLHRRWGGNILLVEPKNGTPARYSWTLTRKADVERFLVRVLPYLMGQRERGERVLELASLPRLVQTDPRREELIAQRERIWKELREMNAREGGA